MTTALLRNDDKNKGGASAKTPKKRVLSLEEALLTLSNKDEATSFLLDLCTPSEIDAFRQRWAIAQLLDNNFSQRDAAEQTAASVTTVTRVARFLQHERHRGYRLVLDRLHPTKNR